MRDIFPWMSKQCTGQRHGSNFYVQRKKQPKAKNPGGSLPDGCTAT